MQAIGLCTKELIGARWCVHQGNGASSIRRVVCSLSFHKVKIGHGIHRAELQHIGIDRHESHITGRKGKMRITKNLSIDQIARSQAVVITQQRNKRDIELQQHIALPFKLGTHAPIGHIATMNHKIDIVTSVYGTYRLLRFIIPALRIAQHSKANFIFSATDPLDGRQLPFVQMLRAINTRIIGMVFRLASHR